MKSFLDNDEVACLLAWRKVHLAPAGSFSRNDDDSFARDLRRNMRSFCLLTTNTNSQPYYIVPYRVLQLCHSIRGVPERSHSSTKTRKFIPRAKWIQSGFDDGQTPLDTDAKCVYQDQVASNLGLRTEGPGLHLVGCRSSHIAMSSPRVIPNLSSWSDWLRRREEKMGVFLYLSVFVI